ncbi:MAG: nucleoside recognition domain-containing protein [Pantoea sp.]|uniref:Nucleoside recognition domain-containing protein n=1 Tax=Pantoea phytobeneficialis TaxID=2052056 RepID=A0AAP9KQV0_9GAMM|nr:nucleoside recognition domain-containing protein [Pantoea phytobeneficialis]MDO6407821.1 nucleoside recognition domain-containing protein [Pantoea phytobeneficialis]QGR08426.1 nucleoside recognition family protein [Pantoea phytobeneficialis]
MNIISIIMSAGKASVDVALYTLIPIMVVMLFVMKYLEAKGVLDFIVRHTTPLLKPLGITGLALFALIQLNFVSFAAPLAALAIMEKRGTSDRHMAATLSMLFAMGQANAFYPLIPAGLHWGAAILISICGGIVAASTTYHFFGRKLPAVALRDEDEGISHNEAKPGLIAIINNAGSDAIRLALGSLPMLILSLSVVGILKEAGGVELLTRWLSPLLDRLNISEVYILPALTKCLAGGTAYYGVIAGLVEKGLYSAHNINASAGLLIQTFDLPGIGIFLGLSSRFPRLFRFAVPGILLGIALRATAHSLLF